MAATRIPKGGRSLIKNWCFSFSYVWLASGATIQSVSYWSGRQPQTLTFSKQQSIYELLYTRARVKARISARTPVSPIDSGRLTRVINIVRNIFPARGRILRDTKAGHARRMIPVCIFGLNMLTCGQSTQSVNHRERRLVSAILPSIPKPRPGGLPKMSSHPTPTSLVGSSSCFGTLFSPPPAITHSHGGSGSARIRSTFSRTDRAG